MGNSTSLRGSGDRQGTKCLLGKQLTPVQSLAMQDPPPTIGCGLGSSNVLPGEIPDLSPPGELSRQTNHKACSLGTPLPKGGLHCSEPSSVLPQLPLERISRKLLPLPCSPYPPPRDNARSRLSQTAAQQLAPPTLACCLGHLCPSRATSTTVLCAPFKVTAEVFF